MAGVVIDCPTFDKQRHLNVVRYFTDATLYRMQQLVPIGLTFDYYNFGKRITFKAEHLELIEREIKAREDAKAKEDREPTD